MRKRITGAVAVAVASIGLIGPASASAECSTTVDCAVETAVTTVDETKQTIDEAVAAAIATVNQKIEEAKALANRVVEDTKQLVGNTVTRANAGVTTCVLQARIKPDGTGTGVADCVRKIANNNQPYTVHGNVTIQGAKTSMATIGRKVSFAGAINPIVIDDNGQALTVIRLDDLAGGEGGLTLHKGIYNGVGPAFTAVAALHTMPASVLPGFPFGDSFINGAVVMTGIA